MQDDSVCADQETRTPEGFPVKDRFLLVQSTADQQYIKGNQNGWSQTSAIYHWQHHESFLLSLFDAQMMMLEAKRAYPDATVMIVRAADWKKIEEKTWDLRDAAKAKGKK